MKKPLIGIMASIGELKDVPGITQLNNTYIISVSKAGGIPIIIPTRLTQEEIKRITELCDGFVFSGGIDITPSFFDEDPHEKLGATSYPLDMVQIPLMQEIVRARKPFLGICRGEQILNVALGGSLYQDISEYPELFVKHSQKSIPGDVSHRVFIEPDTLLFSLFGKEIMTNSYHHQSVKKPGENIVISARSSDGIVEAIEIKDYPFGVGVQWHPEMMITAGDETMCPLFEKLIQAASV